MAELVVGGFTADAVAANRYWTSSALDRNCLSSPARSQVTPPCLDQITPACQSAWFPGLSEAGACRIATLRRSVGSQLSAWRDVSVKPQMDEAAMFNKALRVQQGSLGEPCEQVHRWPAGPFHFRRSMPSRYLFGAFTLLRLLPERRTTRLVRVLQTARAGCATLTAPFQTPMSFQRQDPIPNLPPKRAISYPIAHDLRFTIVQTSRRIQVAECWQCPEVATSGLVNPAEAKKSWEDLRASGIMCGRCLQSNSDICSDDFKISGSN